MIESVLTITATTFDVSGCQRSVNLHYYQRTNGSCITSVCSCARLVTGLKPQDTSNLEEYYIRGGLDHKELRGRLGSNQQLKRGVQLVTLRPSNLPLSLSLSRHLVSLLLSSLSGVIRRTCVLFLCIYLYLTHYPLRNDSQEPKSMDVSLVLRSLRHERSFEYRELCII